MKEKLNIAAILKDKPVGTKLWSPITGECTYKEYDEAEEKINVDFYNKYDESCYWDFSEEGRTYSAASTAQVCLFPSEEMRDWSKFAWKKGDVLAARVDKLCIFDSWANEDYTEFNAKYVSVRYSDELCNTFAWTKEPNDTIIKQYISNIEEITGGKLNLETLEIEHKHQFKDGDVVAYGNSVAICRRFDNDILDFHVSSTDTLGLLYDDSVDSSLQYRLATDSEKQQLFSALEKEGKAWDAEKKQIEDLPKKCEFKPKDWCLIQVERKDVWYLAQYASKFEDRYYFVGGMNILITKELIVLPYNDETRYLLGTTDDWKGGEE